MYKNASLSFQQFQSCEDQFPIRVMQSFYRLLNECFNAIFKTTNMIIIYAID